MSAYILGNLNSTPNTLPDTMQGEQQSQAFFFLVYSQMDFSKFIWKFMVLIRPKLQNFNIQVCKSVIE